MIALIEGTIELRGDRFLVIQTGGVGYKVYVPPETLRIISPNGVIRLWTHTHVREDSMELYGFLHYAEMDFFETLISVSGVGPKSALGILGVAPIDTLKRAIAAGETVYLTKVSGIGKRMAEKIIVELRDKLGGAGITPGTAEGVRDEADSLEALTSMGYSLKDARDALSAVSPEITGMERRLAEALKILGSMHGKK